MAPLPELLSALPRMLRRAAEPDAHLDPTSASEAEMAVHQLAKRSTQSPNFGNGAKPATSFNNQGFLALFALIGAGMVLGSIWFFFWAKNGGFKFREGDWDDYKSTVLRRKGPDGRTLSNATKSTKLGGGSVVHGGTYGAPTSVGYTDSTVDEKEEEERHRAGDGIRGGGRRQKRRKQKDPEMAEYREERAARVGGFNRQHDGTHFDYSNTEPSELGSELSQRPLVKDNAKDKKTAKKEADARQKELRKAQKEATKVQKQKVAENKKREKAKAKEMKKNKGSKDRDYSPAAPDSPQRNNNNHRYDDEYTEVTATSYTGPYTETEVYSDVYTNNDSYYSSYRPNAEANITRPTPAAREYNSGSPRHNRSSAARGSQDRSSRRSSSSPRKQQSHSRHHSRSRHGSRADLGGPDNSDTGTKVYPCHIPGLSSSGGGGSNGVPQAPTIVPEESVSQVGAAGRKGRRGRDVMDGYRRSGPRGRRDSLSDSDS